MKITQIKTLWPENADFSLDRPDIGDEYIFIHFISPVKLFLDGQIHSAPPGSCILFDKHSHQKFTTDGCPLVHDWCHITGCLDSIAEKYGFEYGKPYTVADSSIITSVMQKIEVETLRCDIFSDDAASLYIEELIIDIIRGSQQHGSDRPVNSDTKRRFAALREQICTNYNENWDIAKMADFVNLSQSRFYKLYKDIFGISPKADLQSIRIEHAKTLLLQNKYLIREIAEMTGYSNQYHFIRQFREHTGKTPGKFFGK